MEGDEKRVFSERLVAAMRTVPKARSTRTKHGVDIVALQRVAGVSREMARRYIEGKAMPSPDRMRAITDWLGIRIGWLRDGDGPMHPTDVPIPSDQLPDTRGIADPVLRESTNRLVEAVMRGEVSRDQLEAVLVLLLRERHSVGGG